MKASGALKRELYNQVCWRREGGISTVTLVCDGKVAVVEFRGNLDSPEIIRDDELPRDWGKRLKEARGQRLTGEK